MKGSKRTKNILLPAIPIDFQADLSSEVSAALAAQELAVAREKLSTNRLQAVIQRQRLLETITAVRKAEVEYDMMEATVKRDEVLVGKWAALLHENGHCES